MAHNAQPSENCIQEIARVSLDDTYDQKSAAHKQMLQKLIQTDAFFKHQQIGEPDLCEVEKYKIADEILAKSNTKFLERYWKYLGIEDVVCFENCSSEYEIDFYLKQIKKSKTTNFDKNRTKNRRLKAMQQLISEGDYFSEEEMKYRDPFLYEQLVGQYLDDDEINDKVDKTDLRFSTVLFKHIDILHEHEAYKDQKDTEDGQMEEGESSEDEESEMEDEIEDQKKLIPDEQKAQFRQEFLTIMQERFMAGQDEHFDYSEVDDNTEYDDLDILQKDEEEKYFDADAGDDNHDECIDIDVEKDNMDCSIHNEQCVKDSGKLQHYNKTINHVNSVSLTLGDKSDIDRIKDQSCEKS
ncbi:coiled-coil domain-containing protein 97-like [Mytilus trossulus]|uniref:coiled-coil domain-containing protein 97-like n=1 Tax=Mytilus trossulus TaxID=6551 RepID=UPI003005E985